MDGAVQALSPAACSLSSWALRVQGMKSGEARPSLTAAASFRHGLPIGPPFRAPRIHEVLGRWAKLERVTCNLDFGAQKPHQLYVRNVGSGVDVVEVEDDLCALVHR